MTLESSLRDICANLTSIRATERKKSAETLKDMLSRSAVPCLLSDNTKKKTGYSWNHLFGDINDFILKESEKFETSKNFYVILGLSTSLLNLSVSGANKGSAYIKCDNILEACFNVFNDNRLRKAVGDAYYTLLYKHVLNIDYYMGFISPTSWENLLDVCMNLCITNTSELDNLTKLKLLWLVVKNASDNCQFVIPLRDNITELKKCLVKMENDKKVQDYAMEISLLHLEVLATECRKYMCEFSESILPIIFKFYEQNMDTKKKHNLFRILQVAISVHHPMGKLQNEEGSMANDWLIWNKCKLSILEIVCLEINHMQKSWKQNTQSVNQYCDNFNVLAALIYYQVFNNEGANDLNDEVSESAAKRQKITFNRFKSFGDLVEDLRSNHEPMIGIIFMYLTHFETSISKIDCVELIKVSEQLIQNSSLSINWNEFGKLVCLAIECFTSRCRADTDDHLIALWNACVRNSALANTAHHSVHKIMTTLLKLNVLNFSNVQPLLIFYFEKGMPVSNYSLTTLNLVYHKFYSRCCYLDRRTQCLTWLKQSKLSDVNNKIVRDFLIKLISNENVDLNTTAIQDNKITYDVLFNDIEENILYTNFQYQIPKLDTEKKEDVNIFEINKDMSKIVTNYLIERLSVDNKDGIVKSAKHVHLILLFYNTLLEYKIVTIDDLVSTDLYFSLINNLKSLFTSLTRILRSDTQIRDKIALLKQTQEILNSNLCNFINNIVRSCIPEECFHCINDILKKVVVKDEDEQVYDDDIELGLPGLRHHCVYFLASYCSYTHNYTDEIIKCILDEDIYNFDHYWDVGCVYRCINMVIQYDKENIHLDLVFELLQNMCRMLFRNSKATLDLIKILLKLLDRIWMKNNDVMRQNCIIMVKSYLNRCEKMFYPPSVAVLIYECVARIVHLDSDDTMNLNSTFKDIIKGRLIENIHSTRIYCCYLIKYVYSDLNERDVEDISQCLKDIFVINVSSKNEVILKDETTNRTLTALHSYNALTELKDSLLHDVVFKLISIHTEKSLNTRIVKKVLNSITKRITKKCFDDYVSGNIKNIFYVWFHQNKSFDQLPLSLIGYNSLEDLFTRHMKWLVASEILWCKHGHIENSGTIQYLVANSTKALGDIVEMCFCSIVILCLPYIVIEKYKLEDQKTIRFKSELENASRMFQSTRQILKNDKWSNLFVENMGELILLAATHLYDYRNTKSVFNVNFSIRSQTYTYSKSVFVAVLKYFGELIDGNIMQYLCENQPLVILNILFKLWAIVVNENVLEFKTVNVHAFVSFVENIPFGFLSDKVLFSFVCLSITNAIKCSQTKNEMDIFVRGLKIVLELLSEKSSGTILSLRKSIVSRALSILSTKNEEMWTTSTRDLQKFLMENRDREIGDVVDYVDLITHKDSQSTSKFSENLSAYIENLSFPNYDILNNLKKFLRSNSCNVNNFCKNMDMKGFSEECANSPIHKIINVLSTILKTAKDDKILIEVSSCLAEIWTYDIKTLVTVPPVNTEKVLELTPRQYLTYVTLSTLSNVLFDENPIVSNKVAKAINRLLKFRDSKLILDLADINKEMIQPLAPSNCETFAEYKIDNTKFDLHNSLDLWVPKQNEEHLQWISRITRSVLDVVSAGDNYAAALSAVCALKPSVCANILPAVLGILLEIKSDVHMQILSEQINQFFKYIWNMTFDDKLENTEDGTGTRPTSRLDYNHKSIIHYMINVVDFMRLQAKHYKLRKTRSETLNYLSLDYNKVAWAAALADLNLVAIYYGELWTCVENNNVPPASPEATTNLDGGSHLQRIFRGCFVSIGEMDAVEGCGTAHLTSEEEKRKHLINTGQFADALFLHDIALSYGLQDRGLQYGAVTSLHKSGMHHLALQYIKSCPDNEHLSDVKYDCLSYLGDWSDFVDMRELAEKSKMMSNTNSVTRMFRYACLKDCLNIQPVGEFQMKLENPLNQAKLAIARLCRSLNMENSQCFYKIIANLHLFRDIEKYFTVRCEKESLIKLIDDWRIENMPPYRDFKHLEALISQRSLILQHAADNYGSFSADIISLQIQYAELGLSNQRVQLAQRLVSIVKKFQTSKEITLLESKIAWDKGHKDIALSLLHGNVVDQSENVKLTAMSLRQYGLWMAECKRENARDIIDKYLEKSLNVLKDGDDVNTRLKVYYDIAMFADAEYKQVVAYMNSSTFENKVKCMENMKGTAASLKSSQQALTRDEKRTLIANNAFRELDEAEIANTRAEKQNFLNLAMRYYLLSLKQSAENNLSVFRVISLWFENNTLDLEDASGLGELLHSIPSWKYVDVLPQLAPRLSTDETPFAHYLRDIIKRCAEEHPHHTLPILFNLKNSDKDQKYRKPNTLSSSSRNTTVQEPRVVAATSLITQLASTGLDVVVSQLDQLFNATINFAYFVPTSKEIGKALAIPRTEGISKLRDLDAIPVPTDTIAIRKDCNYSHLSTFASFDNFYELVGGINFPKKISCQSSDGRKRILLIKGEDDLRQDAVMQQVFNIVNTLLQKDPVTYRNKLLIRTYKVVALSRRSGVLEWCEGTMPLGSYLMQAHTHYRPKDITPSTARHKLKDCHDNRKSNKHKLMVFNEILRVFRPVFHYFFTEHYLDPVTWYERRLAYTRSVATSSMVGYILGLGDRHVQNILIDKTTAEVIHIDFGIAFDQGKTLPTPETIPFRLTQDIIAGFGCSGVEGIFRRCCEKTLQLLRHNQETLLTILEVLLCDPLYLWIVPSAAKPAHTNEKSDSSGLARRALLAVSSKLCGAAGGGAGAGAVSVPGEVARLLHEATDHANLSRLFHGWQPYL